MARRREIPKPRQKKRRFLHQCIAAVLLVAGVWALERLWPPSAHVIDNILENSVDITVLQEKAAAFFSR